MRLSLEEAFFLKYVLDCLTVLTTVTDDGAALRELDEQVGRGEGARLPPNRYYRDGDNKGLAVRMASEVLRGKTRHWHCPAPSLSAVWESVVRGSVRRGVDERGVLIRAVR